jgi:hypothetical protein
MSVVGFWICPLDYPALHLIVSHLREENLYERLEGGLLKNGLVLFNDNAYHNTRYMNSIPKFFIWFQG